MYVIVNGQLIKEEKAVISPSNRSFRYGDGFFETIKWVKGCAPLIDLHTERIFYSLQFLQFTHPSFFTKNYIEQQLAALAAANGNAELARIRITFYAGDGGLYDFANRQVNWLIQYWPITEQQNKLNENGLVIGLYNEGIKAADRLANIKSNNFLLYSQAVLFVQQQKWNEALVLNHKNTIADATIANAFFIKDKTIVTPPLTDGPVDGVMRRYLLERLPALGFDVLEASVAVEDIASCDEVFLSNAMGIRWVGSYENKSFSSQHIIHIYSKMIQPLFS